jgi:ribonuclease HI
MMTKSDLPIVIFTDGASSGNPGPGGWGAVIAMPEGKILELGGRESSTTNNRMELTGAIRALITTKGADQRIHLYTDSTYVIQGITKWIWGWRKRNWITSEGKEVANTDLWKELSSLVQNQKIEWKYVRGHTGVPGNERTDEIAVAFSKGVRPNLYDGPLLKYSVPIYDLPPDTDLPEMKPKQAPSRPYSYLSVVDNVPMRHSTWAECETRVKGRSGAKFKKAMSLEEEIKILKLWGVSL